jgi:hypothetical protein
MSLHYQQALPRSSGDRDLLLVSGTITLALLAFAIVEIVIAIAIGATLAEALAWATLSIIF